MQLKYFSRATVALAQGVGDIPENRSSNRARRAKR
jgi:hypothetical protein